MPKLQLRTSGRCDLKHVCWSRTTSCLQPRSKLDMSKTHSIVADSVVCCSNTLSSSRREVIEFGCVFSLVHVFGVEALAEQVPQEPKVYFDFSIDGKPAGRVIIQVFSGLGVAGERFTDLAIGKMGVGYRRTKVDAVNEDFIRLDGVSSLTYSSSAESPISGGEDVFKLEKELADSSRKHDEAGLVSLVVKGQASRAPKEKLVATGGKLVKVQEPAPPGPNGTAFAITTGAAPELDSTNLIVGRVVSGMDLVKRISELPAVKDNTSSPYFMAAKAIGDKRADVAEKGFNKPYSKVVITKCGAI
mmetsp:Transcript_41952/g.99505  ORF Transcript_41952/g.99505 Transcript_41952/m.99505 type:complete len:303 (+) Transcript_41952:132-1040(+)